MSILDYDSESFCPSFKGSAKVVKEVLKFLWLHLCNILKATMTIFNDIYVYNFIQYRNTKWRNWKKLDTCFRISIVINIVMVLQRRWIWNILEWVIYVFWRWYVSRFAVNFKVHTNSTFFKGISVWSQDFFDRQISVCCCT